MIKITAMAVVHPLLSRRPARALPSYSVVSEAPDIQVAQGRVHEACGPARRTFAMWLAMQTQGPVFWVAVDWEKDRLHAEGVSAWIDPARLFFVSPRRAEDLFWTLEEILRSGAVAFAVAELPALPNLTQVRRLHLAAETGAQMGQFTPTGLLTTPGTGGAPGVETRWHLAQKHSAGTDGWALERLRARTAPRKSWSIHKPQATLQPRIKSA